MGVSTVTTRLEQREIDIPWEGQHPQTSANADASEPFTLRAIVSSIRPERTLSKWWGKSGREESGGLTDDVPQYIHVGHDADEEHLRGGHEDAAKRAEERVHAGKEHSRSTVALRSRQRTRTAQ